MASQNRPISNTYLLLLTCFILGLVACNQTPTPTESPSAKGYTLDVRGGISNLDDSFFNPIPSSGNPQVLRLRQMHSLLSHLGVAIQANQGIGVNIYVSLAKNGAALAQKTPFNLKGPEGSYTGPFELEAGQVWEVLYPLVPKGTGDYSVTTTLEDVTLVKKVTIDPKNDPLLPIPQQIAVSSTPDTLLASWQPVAGAQSYLAAVYDHTQQKFVWIAQSKATKFVASIQLSKNVFYDLTVFALSWDAGQSVKAPYPQPLPARFNMSAASRGFSARDPQLTGPYEQWVNLGTEPNKSLSTSLDFYNSGDGPLLYEMNISGSEVFKLKVAASGVLYYQKNLNATLEATCPAQEGVYKSKLTLKTNDPQKPVTEVPLTLECIKPLQAEQILRRVNHAGGGKDLVWSSNGKWIATADLEGRVFIWDAATTSLVHEIRSANIVDLDWSPDGQKLLGVGGSIVHVWSSATGNEIIAFNSPDTINGATWSPTGDKIAVALTSQVIVYDAVTGEKQFSFNQITSGPIKWSPDGSKIALAGYGTTTTTLIYSSTGTKLKELNSGPTQAIAWNSTGTQLATGQRATYASQYVSIWNASDWSVSRTLQPPGNSSVNNLVWSPDNTQLALATTRVENSSLVYDVQIWQTSSGTFQRSLPSEGSVGLDWRGSEIAIMEGSGLTKLWNASTGANTGMLGVATQSPDFSGDNSTLVGFQGQTIGTYSLLTGQKLIKGLVGTVIETLHWSGSNEIIGVVFNGNGQGEIRKWNAQTGEQISSVPLAGRGSYYRWSKDGKQLGYYTSNNSTWHIVSTNTGQELFAIANTGDPDWNLSGTQIVVSGYNSSDIYDAATGNKVRTIQTGSNPVVWVDNNRLASTVQLYPNLGLYIFDAVSGKKLMDIDLGAVSTRLKVSPDGRKIAVLKPNSIDILSLNSGNALLSIPTPQIPGSLSYGSPVREFIWSSDNQYLAFANVQNTLEVYRINPAP